MKNDIKKQYKIAFPTSDKSNVDEHFGHCKYFAIYNVDGNEVVGQEFVEAPPHEPGVLPAFLGKLNATTIITGGMGKMAIDLFKNQNIDVILGASGNISENLNVYLNGTLDSVGEACEHDHH